MQFFAKRNNTLRTECVTAFAQKVNGPIAQLDRAFDYESRGREFESSWVRHFLNIMFPDFIKSPDKFNTSCDDILVLKSNILVDYPDAVSFMEDYIAQIKNHNTPEAIWFLEHPDIYTAGTSAQSEDLLHADKFPVYQTGRGGQYTYHGPKQLICYVMIDLHKRKIGVREFVKSLEHIIIQSLKPYGLDAEIREGRVGVWIPESQTHSGTEDKIAAIGIRIRKGISFHGFAVNLAPNLQNFTGIVPCGLSHFGVTSLEVLKKEHHREQCEDYIKLNFSKFF